jgi:IS30 family transposase
MTTWFCDAYSRGKRAGSKTPTVDYAAGCLVRSTSTKYLTRKSKTVVITANLTPRKCLGFKTPFQAILKELGKDVQIRFA